MLTGLIDNYKKTALGVMIGLSGAGVAHAQNALPGIEESSSETTLSVNHSSSPQAMPDGSVADSVNIGVLYAPATGLQLRAGAWKLQSELAAATTTATMPLYIDDTSVSLEHPFGPSLPQGIDLSASYVWESPRFGQFILSTKASYMYGFNRDEVADGAAARSTTGSPLLGSELQSSLTLTWQIGKHRASAMTNYADQIEMLGTFDMEELNRLVGNLTTLDLQYGYTLKAGRDGEAMISVGVRSVLDDQASRFLPRPVGTESTGRMAYGTIKYQF